MAADPARVASAEAHLGFALDEGYRNFLLHADGWPAFYQSVDLFGTPELVGDERMQHALRGLSYIEPIVLAESRVTPAELLPIAATTLDMDLFVITTPRARRPGEVIWFAADEVERFASFDEFFLAMADYNRREWADLERSAPASDS